MTEEEAKTVEITDELRKTYFRNYGWANGWSEETYQQDKIATILHSRDRLDHPELHKTEWESGHCTTKMTCSCGYGYSADSSD